MIEECRRKFGSKKVSYLYLRRDRSVETAEILQYMIGQFCCALEDMDQLKSIAETISINQPREHGALLQVFSRVSSIVSDQVVLIDALDEVAEGQNQKLADFLKEMKRGSRKLFVTSRATNETLLQALNYDQTYQLVPDDVRSDIKLIIRSTLDSNYVDRNLQYRWLRDEIVRIMTDKAKGM